MANRRVVSLCTVSGSITIHTCIYMYVCTYIQLSFHFTCNEDSNSISRVLSSDPTVTHQLCTFSVHWTEVYCVSGVMLVYLSPCRLPPTRLSTSIQCGVLVPGHPPTAHPPCSPQAQKSPLVVTRESGNAQPSLPG